MDKKNILILGIIGVAAFILLTKSKASTTPATQRAQALQQAETGLIGAGVNLITSAVNKALSVFSPSSPGSTGGTTYGTQSTDVGVMIAPSDLENLQSAVEGYFQSTPYLASDLNAYASI